MPLTLQNFDKDADTITLRGKDYFTSGAVTSLEEVDEGEWEADVQGSEEYEVAIELSKNKIKYTYCCCPYFEENEDCKHIAAVLYAIRDKTITEAPKETAAPGKEKKPKAPKTKSPYQEMLDIAEKTEAPELRVFIKSYAAYNKDFTGRFLFHFKQQSVANEATIDGFKDLIKEAVKNSTEKSRGYKYLNENKLYKHLKPLLNQAKKYLSEKNYLEGSYIVKALIEELIAIYIEIGQYDQRLKDMIEECFELLHTIVIADVSHMFKDELYEYSLQKAQEDPFIKAGADSYFDSILILLTTDNHKKEQLLKSLDTRVEKISSKQPGPMHYSALSRRLGYLKTKIELLTQARRTIEAENVIRDNVYYHDEFRRQEVEKAIKEKQYDYAGKLIKDKISGNSVKKEGIWTNMNDHSEWKTYYLQIATAENKTDEIVRYAIDLFFSTADFKYYDLAKKHTSPVQWKEKVHFITTIRNQSRVNSFNVLADIYIQENMLDDLFNLLKKDDSLYHLSYTIKPLFPTYKKEILALYKKALNQSLSGYPDTSVYPAVRDHLNLLADLGEKKMVTELVTDYKILYRNRRKLLEELNKVKI